MTTLRFATFNFANNGGQGRATTLAMLNEYRLDALMLQELADDDAQAAATAEALGMHGGVAEGNPVQFHNGIFLRKDVFPGFQLLPKKRLTRMYRIRPCDVTTYWAERPDVPITMVNLHLSPFVPGDRLDETHALAPVAGKARDGQPVFIGGDFNELPQRDGEVVDDVDWKAVTEEVHRTCRARRANGGWESITDVDQLLHDMGMRDVAKHVARKYGKPEALAATAGHHRRDEGGEVRIDRMLVPAWMVDAVVDVEVIDVFGDHRMVVAEVSPTRLAKFMDAKQAAAA